MLHRGCQGTIAHPFATAMILVASTAGAADDNIVWSTAADDNIVWSTAAIDQVLWPAWAAQ